MIDKASTDNDTYITSVKILDVEKRYRPGPKHYVYIIQVTWANPENVFIIYRRYAQFFDLQCKLLDLFAEAPSPSNNYNTKNRQIPFLPGKIFLGRSQIRQIALERKHALGIYLRTLISLPERISRSRPVLDFFQPLPTDVQNPSEFMNTNKNSVTNNSINISEPSKLPTYRCLDNFTSVEKTEMSLKRHTLVQIIQRHLNGWWFVQNGDRTGFVPGAFLKPTDPQQDIHEIHSSIIASNEPYVVNQTYEGKSSDEISLNKGSFVTVLQKSYTGWWIVQFNNNTGQFPAVYLSSCKGRILPENINEGPTIASNKLIRRLSCLNDYEQNDNTHESPKEIESELYYVHTDFQDNIGGCVPLERGDMVEIHEKHSSGWWLGRRLKDDFILTWIPSAFLQKEATYETVHNSFSQSQDDEHRQDRVSMDNIYANFPNVMYTEVLKNEQPIETRITSEQTVVHEEEEPTKISVRDLVKKFSRQ